MVVHSRVAVNVVAALSAHASALRDASVSTRDPTVTDAVLTLAPVKAAVDSVVEQLEETLALVLAVNAHSPPAGVDGSWTTDDDRVVANADLPRQLAPSSATKHIHGAVDAVRAVQGLLHARIGELHQRAQASARVPTPTEPAVLRAASEADARAVSQCATALHGAAAAVAAARLASAQHSGNTIVVRALTSCGSVIATATETATEAIAALGTAPMSDASMASAGATAPAPSCRAVVDCVDEAVRSLLLVVQHFAQSERWWGHTTAAATTAPPSGATVDGSSDGAANSDDSGGDDDDDDDCVVSLAVEHGACSPLLPVLCAAVRCVSVLEFAVFCSCRAADSEGFLCGAPCRQPGLRFGEGCSCARRRRCRGPLSRH